MISLKACCRLWLDVCTTWYIPSKRIKNCPGPSVSSEVRPGHSLSLVLVITASLSLHYMSLCRVNSPESQRKPYIPMCPQWNWAILGALVLVSICWWFLGITHRTSLWIRNCPNVISFSKQVDVYVCVVLCRACVCAVFVLSSHLPLLLLILLWKWFCIANQRSP